MFIINFFLGLGFLANSYMFKFIVDALSKVAHNPRAVSEMARLILILAALRILIALFNFIQEILTDRSRLGVHINLRRKIFEHTLGLSIEYYENNRAGDISQQLSQGVFDFANWLFEVSQTITVQIISLFVAVVAIILKNPLAGVIALVAVPLHIAVSLRKIHKTKPLRRQASILAEASMGHLNETIQNMTTIRTLGSEKAQYKRYYDISEQLKQIRYKQYPIAWGHNAGRELVEAFATVLVVGVVALGAIQGRYSAGDILLVALLIQQAMGNLRPIAKFIDSTGDVATSCQRIIDLLEVEPTVIDLPQAQTLQEINSIEFRNVTFTYPGLERDVLEGVSFILERGQTLALVGPSGTGKTTLIKLLLRLYDPTGGEYLINGRPAQDFTGNSVREHMGVVMQDVALFNATFEENLRLARPEVNQDELETAVKLAHAQEFVEKLPYGYQTLVGERGIRLSGGQKQRLAIARAILKQPQLVILDEATSALDSVSEHEVQAGLATLLKERMSVIIAHRLSTIRHADLVLVIENGRVEEQGNHKELMKTNGLYAQLYNMQSDRLLK